MYRLRKRSDAKRTLVLEQPQPLSVQPKASEPPIPALPPADDFRTSLILPDLLRASSGTPIALDDLKSKFAEQRARGSRNQVTEEEEDMILEALGRLHARAARTKVTNSKEASSEQSASRSESQDLGSLTSSSSLARDSLQSSSTTPTALHSATSISSLSSTKGSNASRRMSNNLFGSGKLRDQTYIRSANQGRRTGVGRSGSSVAPSDSMMSMSTISSSRAGQSSMYSDSVRPSTPDDSTYTPSNSVPSSPNNDKAFEKQRARQSAQQESDSEFGADRKDLTTRLSRALSPDVLRRASLALDEVIREMEEEGDDEIVMERTTLHHVHGTTSNGSTSTPTEHRSPLASPGEYGTAVSSDDRVVLTQSRSQSQTSTTEMRSPTASPAPRLPGYIPGMPRPMTPRDSTFDSDDQTPSNTPRATSPRLPSGAPPSPRVIQPLSSSLYRSNSVASSSRQSPAPVSTPTLGSTPPLFFNRSVNGRFTPEDRQRSGTSSPVTDVFDSSAQSRRRPMSPLSGPAYQALTNNSSRPTTPSNVTWNPSPNATSSHVATKSVGSSLHSKNGSTISVSDVLADGLERAKSTSRSLRSPALPESPLMDRNYGLTMALESDYRPPSAMSGMELGSPLQMNNRPLRSPTPTHGRQKSPTMATFPEGINASSSGETSNPSRRQNHHSSFSLGSSSGLLLSPIANSSRSSIESAGSSYHSWDEDHKKDRLYGLFSSLDPDHTEWHDVSTLDQSASSTPGTSPYESLDVEDTVRKNTGMTKSDFIAVQDRLVKAAILKVNTPSDGRARANSLRRRRPSTSQSTYSLTENRVASPAPHVQPVATAAPTKASEHNAKVSALLESVVYSIESPRAKSPPSLPTSESHVQPEPVSSNPGRRHKALADALFGSEVNERPPTPGAQALLSPGSEGRRSRAHTTEVAADSISSPPSVTTLTQTTPTIKSPMSPNFNPLQADLSHVDATRLAMEVQRRAEAATAELRKSPSNPRLGEPTSMPHPHRKRIDPRQISSPKLVSSSINQNTIPLPSLSHKVSRFRKLTGTLRAKDIPSPALEQHSPSSAPLPSHLPRFSPTAGAQSEHTASRPQGRDHGKASPPDPSPPASSSPGIRSFISRFRKPRNMESYSATQRERPSPSVAALSPTSPSYNSLPVSQVPRSAPALQTYFDQPVTNGPRVPPATLTESQASPQEAVPPQVAEEPPVQSGDAAIKQLFAAASDLGLDQKELHNLLARSPSTSSKLTRAASVTEGRKSHLPGVREDDISGRPLSPFLPTGRPSMDGYSNRPSQDGFRPSMENVPEITLRTPREGPADAAANPIVRRTIIFPSDPRSSAADLNTLMHKQSAARKRRSAGANSTHSIRSVHERVPTPPPHKTGRLFSTDGSPPVPQLPLSLGSQSEQLAVPAQMESSNSAYDSLYEMYTGEAKSSGASNMEPHGASGTQQSDANPENGPALELIELANGEMIWNIVNGLRDDDGESFYGDRSSFVSEYSRRDSAGEGLRLFFKGHEKKGSKGSNVSTSTRKRYHPKPSVRPETKVFFSSPAQIGQLIDNLSRGVDAGSFNITPETSRARQLVGHSASSSIGSESEARWTLEERRLQQLLGSLGSTQ